MQAMKAKPGDRMEFDTSIQSGGVTVRLLVSVPRVVETPQPEYWLDGPEASSIVDENEAAIARRICPILHDAQLQLRHQIAESLVAAACDLLSEQLKEMRGEHTKPLAAE